MTNSTSTSTNTDASRSGRATGLADGALMLVGLLIAQRALGLLRSVLCVRWLEPDQLGEWDLALSFLLIAAPLIVLGLPGSFGRYLEHYAHRGQARAFLRRTATACIVLAMGSAAVVWLGRDKLGPWLLSEAADHRDIVTLAGALAVVAMANFVASLLAALRMTRHYAVMQFATTALFALLSILAVRYWQATSDAVVLCYAAASALGVLFCARPLIRAWRERLDHGPRVAAREMWGRLLPFAFWIWSTDLVTNLFASIDRYMLLHCGHLAPSDALAAVGQYHSARIVPVLLTTLAYTLSTLVTPHLAHDWEAGRRAAVSQRLGMFLKLTSFALTTAAAAVLIAAPWIFSSALGGKYHAGETLLPWTLVCGIWLGLFGLSQNYLWCAERASLPMFTMLGGLVLNVVLNLLLLPHFGLLGAVASTVIANLIALVATLSLCRTQGMRVEPRTWLAVVMPTVIWFGPWAASIALIALLVATMLGYGLLTPAESAQARNYLSAWKSRIGRILPQRRGITALAGE